MGIKNTIATLFVLLVLTGCGNGKPMTAPAATSNPPTATNPQTVASNHQISKPKGKT